MQISRYFLRKISSFRLHVWHNRSFYTFQLRAVKCWCKLQSDLLLMIPLSNLHLYCTMQYYLQKCQMLQMGNSYFTTWSIWYLIPTSFNMIFTNSVIQVVAWMVCPVTTWMTQCHTVVSIVMNRISWSPVGIVRRLTCTNPHELFVSDLICQSNPKFPFSHWNVQVHYIVHQLQWKC